ncbi:MAG: dTMP kinase [Negativicutes bacterium]|nr:dTMP kinase [Negativicutes bacterium]
MPFITFEGIDASGKTTQITRLAETLQKLGAAVLVTREPRGTEVGVVIGNLVLDRKDLDILPATEVFLFAADRCQHVRQVINPALRQGQFVLSDRFVDSSIAFQGAAGLELDFIRAVNQLAVNGLKPDLTFWLDLPAEETMKRIARRGEGDRLESKGIVYEDKVRALYQLLADQEPRRFVKIDSTAAPAEMAKTIAAIVRQRFLL